MRLHEMPDSLFSMINAEVQKQAEEVRASRVTSIGPFVMRKQARFGLDKLKKQLAILQAPRPSEYRTGRQLLNRFYYLNTFGRAGGHKTVKRPYPDNCFHAFGYAGHFIIYVEQDRISSNHTVHLRFKSHFDDKCYDVATSSPIPQKYFFNPQKFAETLALRIKLRQFKISIATYEQEIPYK